MIHLRVVAPPELAYATHRALLEHPSAVNVVRIRDVAERPGGDLILLRRRARGRERRRRAAARARARARRLDRARAGLGDRLRRARRAEEAAVGSPADAVVWETVELQTSESAELSVSFLAFMVLATMIAALGILQDSLILIIGAMVVGPEFGPLAGLCVALVQRRAWPGTTLAARTRDRLPARESRLRSRLHARPRRGRTPRPDELRRGVATRDVLHLAPGRVLRARRAARGHRRRALADDGEVGRARRSPDLGDDDPRGGERRRRSRVRRVERHAGGAAAQLAVNLVCIVTAVVATLSFQRWVYRRGERVR